MVPAAAGTLGAVTDATNPFRPHVAPPDAPVAASPDAPVAAWPDAPVNAPADAPVAETDLLDRLEADLAAVDTAIATIERISTDGVGGEQAAVEINAAVSPERFGTAETPAAVDVVGRSGPPTSPAA